MMPEALEKATSELAGNCGKSVIFGRSDHRRRHTKRFNRRL